MKIEATINRIYQDDCTVGVLNHSSGFRCMTLELPWMDNKPNISCIPHGVYECEKRYSPKNGDVFQLRNVIDRTYIQCHTGNYTSQIQGCILVGDTIKDINKDGILDVANSKKTHNHLMSLLPKIFLMEIK